jgi:hypothetical protein
MKTVHVYSVAYNRPDFIKLQHQTIEKYFVPANNEYKIRFIVMINTKDQEMKERLIHACSDIGVKYTVVPHKHNELYNGGLTAYNFVRNNYFPNTSEEDYSVIMDSDMFFYNYLNIEKLVAGNDVCAIYHQRQKKILGFTRYNYEYLWVGFMIFSHKHFTWHNLKFEPIKNICDVGGMTYYFLKENKKKGLKVKWLLHTPDITTEFKEIFPESQWNNYNPNMGVQLIEDAIIHYYRGSNWDGSDKCYLQKKDKFLYEFLNQYQGLPLNMCRNYAYDSIAYSRKHFNGQLNNNNNKIIPSFGSFSLYN